MSLGANIREAREAAFLSGKQLAYDAKITRSWLSLIENDHATPSGKTLRAIAAALNTTAQQLTANKEFIMADPISRKLATAANQLAGMVNAGTFDNDDERFEMTTLSILMLEWADEVQKLEETAKPPTSRESRVLRLFGPAGPSPEA